MTFANKRIRNRNAAHLIRGAIPARAGDCEDYIVWAVCGAKFKFHPLQNNRLTDGPATCLSCIAEAS